jgi:two-component system, NtrC family, response regulator AtoC
VRDRRIDVRILAATNRDLGREAQREQFRRDLYFRLAVIILHLPPLRERGNDILILAEYFIKRFNAKYGKQVRTIDGRARESLLTYPWPGNVRELSHVMERAVLWNRGSALLDLEHLSLGNPLQSTPSAEVAVPETGPPAEPVPVLGSPVLLPPGVDLEGWEKSLIEQALREAEGNQTRAAQRLGISRDTLRYRLKKHGIQGYGIP